MASNWKRFTSFRDDRPRAAVFDDGSLDFFHQSMAILAHFGEYILLLNAKLAHLLVGPLAVGIGYDRAAVADHTNYRPA